MRANAISHPQTQRDAVRMLSQAMSSPFDSVRRRQTPGTVLDFPDTAEVTGSNPVRPTHCDLALWLLRPEQTWFLALRVVGPGPIARDPREPDSRGSPCICVRPAWLTIMRLGPESGAGYGLMAVQTVHSS